MTRLAAQFCGALLILGFIFNYWWIVALLVAAVVVWKWLPGWWEHQKAAESAERQRLAEVAARADEQHHLVLQGNQRGTYGPAWPTVRKYQKLAK